jgi:hypothetical protein
VMRKQKEDNKAIKPWPGVRALKDYEWKRDLDEDIQDESRHRSIPAFFAKIEKDKPWYSPNAVENDNPSGYYDEAIFQEEDGNDEFRVARRLVGKNLKVGDHVVLEVGGCCTIMFPPKLVRERT